MNHALKIFLFAVVMVLAACENEAYESGDGGLSAMRADFVEMRTDGNSNITSIETDDGEELWLTQAISTAWAERPDTVYRALMYYNKVADGEGAPKAEPLAVSQVLVPQITPIGQLVGEMKTDPVALVSAWKSPNGRYVNLELSLKTGAADGGTGLTASAGTDKITLVNTTFANNTAADMNTALMKGYSMTAMNMASPGMTSRTPTCLSVRWPLFLNLVMPIPLLIPLDYLIVAASSLVLMFSMHCSEVVWPSSVL